MRFSLLLLAAVFLVASILVVATSAQPSGAFREKSCGKAIMARFWSLCPAGPNTNDPRQLYFATLLCGVGFTDHEIQSVMCPSQIEQE